MVFTPYDLFSWNKHGINFNISNITSKYIITNAFLTMLALCTMALLHHAWPVLPSSSCSMLPPSLLGVNCLSSPPLAGPGPPSPPSPELTPFPSGPRQRPTLMLGTLMSHIYINSTGTHIGRTKNFLEISRFSTNLSLWLCPPPPSCLVIFMTVWSVRIMCKIMHYIFMRPRRVFLLVSKLYSTYSKYCTSTYISPN